MKTFEEFRKEISIIDLARSIGYEQDVSKGDKWPVFVNKFNNEKIIIVNSKSSSNQGYWNPEKDLDKGTLINFVKNRLGVDFNKDSSLSDPANINKVLYTYLNIPIPISREFIPFIKEIKTDAIVDFTTKNLTSSLIDNEYLLMRNLDTEVLSLKIFSGKILNLKENHFVNIAFPFFDKNESIVAIQKKNEKYDGFVAGSQRDHSIWHSNMPEILNQIIITESVIDGLSYHQLKPMQNVIYVATGGSISKGQINTILELRKKVQTSESFHYVSAVDNDKTGIKYDALLTALLAPEKVIIDKPVSKDYNEDLFNFKRNKNLLKHNY